MNDVPIVGVSFDILDLGSNIMVFCSRMIPLILSLQFV